ncbi:MAG: ThuA domain-containing protein [Planctomycetota bacterium]
MSCSSAPVSLGTQRTGWMTLARQFFHRVVMEGACIGIVATFSILGLCVINVSSALAEEVGDRWGTEEREREYYPLVNVPVPKELVIEAGAFCLLPDGRVAVGTRHGEVYFISGLDADKPTPTYHRFATGLDEIFGLDYRDGALYVTQSCEVTRLLDTKKRGVADRFETVSDSWGYANYHEYAFGSKFDASGKLHVALGLSNSYDSHALFRGFVMQVDADGKSRAMASGLRSPGGIGFNEHGALFYIESQGPWNCSCSLKAVTPGSFQGHPASFNWYPFASEMGETPELPKSNSRTLIERQRVKQLVPYAVIFPYIRMGRSITGFVVNRSGGKFGPFENQLFLGDYTLSIVMRATTEQINGVWQGACYPFREGLSTGILNLQFTPGGKLVSGGTNRGWPVRGIKPFALERLEWSGKMPHEIERITITSDGFRIAFTKPVDTVTGGNPESYQLSTFTHPYHGGYGGPEIERTKPVVKSVALSGDGRVATITVGELQRGHVYEFDLAAVLAADGEKILHRHAYYTVNEVPLWLSYPGVKSKSSGKSEARPGSGKKIVLIAADQEYRSEDALPQLAKILATHHGFDCTVLFSVNEKNEADPTRKIRWEDKTITHNIPGLEQLDDADLMILFSRLITLPEEQLQHIYRYLDSGKPLIGIRTANHGFLGFNYQQDGKRIDFGEHVLGGSFRNHHGRWQADSTRGVIVDEQRAHPILRGVKDIWGLTDVYRTYKEGDSLPAGCTALVLGQPLLGRKQTDEINRELAPLPVAWVKNWTGNTGKTARVFHSTMGSGEDYLNEGLRRLTVNATYWCLGMESQIDPQSSVDLVGKYEPHSSGFNNPKLNVVPRPISDLR